MDIYECIASAFWQDYCADREESGAQIGTHVDILRVFLVWLQLRTERGPVIDMRLAKRKGARETLNQIMGVE